MNGRMQMAGAALAFLGIVGTSALATVTALHVSLEHANIHDLGAPEHGHHHPGQVGHHEHAPRVPDHGHAHQAEAPEHDHALALVATVGRLSAGAALAEAGAVLATPLMVLDTPSRASARPCGAGPPARAAPLCRRSVILQV